MAGTTNGTNGQVPQAPRGLDGKGGLATPQRRYYPASEQGPRMHTADMQQYINPFTGEQQTGSGTGMNHLNAMAEKYGTDGDWMDGVDRNAAGGNQPPAGGMRPMPMPQPMPFPPQGGPAVRPPAQPAGFNINTAAAQGLQDSMNTTGAELNYRPMEANAALVGQQGYQADTLAGQDLSAYTNPYENQVVQQSLDDLERSRLMAQNVGGAQAGAANAFGGSRQGIAEAETNRAYADQAARTASGLRQSGYMNAQQQAQQDIANRNQASQFGASASNQAGQLNQSAINQMRLANQNAGLSGSQQRLNAGQQLGNLSNLGFGMGQQIQGRMDQQGAAQQNLQQQIINAAKGQYGGFTGAPNQSLQALLAAVGGAPAVGSQTKGYTPGLFDYLSLGAGMT